MDGLEHPGLLQVGRCCAQAMTRAARRSHIILRALIS
jgi:hypothetical protein